jgi:hypothetical protein
VVQPPGQTGPQSLLLKSVIEEIPPTQSTPGFYSRLFLVPKKTEGMRPVIDLSILNSYLSVNFVVPDKSEKFPGSQRNWDMEISIRKVQFGGQHTSHFVRKFLFSATVLQSRLDNSLNYWAF